jgi:hypothetical protein
LVRTRSPPTGTCAQRKDLDVWVKPSLTNAVKVMQALSEFGAPLLDLTVDDLARPGLIFQMGVPPIGIDVITLIDGVEFDAAWPERLEAKLGGQIVHVLSRTHLIANKKAAGRLQDLADVEKLEQVHRRRQS